MAVWAVGDIQGCYRSLQELLTKIAFDPAKDRLWIAGDLVNRGKGSLETLEYLYSIRESVEIVLGNHDLMLVAAYYGFKKSNPTIDPILSSPNAKELIDWLRRQKFLHVDHQLGYCMSHAGISPEFDLDMAMRHSQRIEKRLQGADAKAWLKKMFSIRIDHFDTGLSETEMDAYTVNTFTRMRYCYKDLRLEFDQKGTPTDEVRETGLMPWFECDARRAIELKSIFGHWSTLGFYNNKDVLSLDTGCLWDRELTAARLDLDELEVVSVECAKE